MTKESVKISGIAQSVEFTVVLPESAVRALEVIGQFGVNSLADAIHKTLSPSEAKAHRAGFEELVLVGVRAKSALYRLDEARKVASGEKVAVLPAQAP